MTSVLIVDDNLLVREGLKHLLSQEHRGLAFGEATNGQEVAARLAKRAWDVVVIEVSIPGHDGFQTLQEIRRSYPATRVVMLSRVPSPEHALRARQLKAAGYSAKNSSRAELLRVFHNVLAGKEHFAGAAQGASKTLSAPVPAALSGRERDVLIACVAGKRVGEIAGELNLSIKTVSTYKRRILNKLQLKSVAELVRHAIDHKLC
jgi:two-component system invasion response regulator UvrY